MKDIMLTAFKFILATALITSGLSAFAIDCYKRQTQQEVTICSGARAKTSLINLEKAIVSHCEKQEDIQDNINTSMYPSLMNSCIADTANKIAKKLK